MVAADLCSFLIRNVVSGPAASPGITCLKSEHKSAGAVTVGAAATIDSVGSSKGGAVFVAVGNGSGVCVGGMGVAVGSAACVSAIIVKAAATAVPCISSTLMVGSGSGPHALSIKVPRINGIKILFIG